ncbi:hypothetical protein AVDCRST_MAG92-4611 [uncultured Coleofasciculus sp.]|uniref:Uncharacterized protein n=1 Tax=uncultured Coleofasciculus sp. TaxID=1267456 RepID=A0A6J4K430_9CYAN|nr:hypothetical protein AVDCRST_MAG92-4611 [uncultured Coleofasciculus sp.]
MTISNSSAGQFDFFVSTLVWIFCLYSSDLHLQNRQLLKIISSKTKLYLSKGILRL